MVNIGTPEPDYSYMATFIGQRFCMIANETQTSETQPAFGRGGGGLRGVGVFYLFIYFFIIKLNRV